MSEPDHKDVYLRLPIEIHQEAERRVSAVDGQMSIQTLIILTLATAWKVPPPSLRSRGRQRKRPDSE